MLTDTGPLTARLVTRISGAEGVEKLPKSKLIAPKEAPVKLRLDA